jgi:beta-xylosidase
VRRIQDPAVYFASESGFYYLFVTHPIMDEEDVEIASEIRVGRSLNPDGPYLNEYDESMMDGPGKLFLDSEPENSVFVRNPGHPGIFKAKNEKIYFTF